MRLSELLHCEVFDNTGSVAGHVHDVRLVQDGAVGSGFDAALRVEGLIIGHGAIANRLGYGRSGSRGPWLVRVLATLGRPATFVPWPWVAAVEPGRIELAVGADRLEPVRPLREIRGAARS